MSRKPRLASALGVVIMLLNGAVPVMASDSGSAGVHDVAREHWIGGFLKIQEASAAVADENLGLALELYEEALDVFRDVAEKYPDWRPGMVRFRVDFCKTRIRRLQQARDVDADKRSKPDLILELQRAQEQKKKAAQLAKQREQKLAELRKGVEALRSERERLAQEAAKGASASAERERLQAGLRTARDKLDAAEQARALAEAARQTVTREQAATATELRNALAAAQQTLAKQSETLAQLQQAKEEQKARLEQNATRLADQAQQLEAKEAALAQVQADCLTLRNQLADAGAKSTKARQQATERQAALATLETELAQARKRGKELQRAVDLADATDLATLDKELQAARTELGQAAAARRELQQALLAKEESERRLLAEKQRRLQDERELAQQKQERKRRRHELLSTGAKAEGDKDYELAVASFKGALELDPDNLDALTRIGMIYAAMGQDVEAELYLERAFQLDPSDPKLLLPLGFSQINQEKIFMAISTLARAVALEPENAAYHRFLGVACRSVGWTDAARAAFEQSFRIDSNSAETAYNMAILLATLDEPQKEKAKTWYEKAKELGASPDPDLEAFFGE